MRKNVLKRETVRGNIQGIAVLQFISKMDKRFDQMIAFLWMLTGIFTALTLGVIGFAYWDRRELSKSNGEVAKVLRQFHIL